MYQGTKIEGSWVREYRSIEKSRDIVGTGFEVLKISKEKERYCLLRGRCGYSVSITVGNNEYEEKTRKDYIDTLLIKSPDNKLRLSEMIATSQAAKLINCTMTANWFKLLYPTSKKNALDESVSKSDSLELLESPEQEEKLIYQGEVYIRLNDHRIEEIKALYHRTLEQLAQANNERATRELEKFKEETICAVNKLKNHKFVLPPIFPESYLISQIEYME